MLLVATTNPGKLRDIGVILHGLPIALVTLREFPNVKGPSETGTTFAENARLKALYYAEATGLPSVADDSGLEIEALDRAPGVHSARWHGSDYAEKFRRIHELLRARGLATSPARFVCHLALARRGRVLYEASGIVEGRIAAEPRGTNGFGYDPLFYYPPFGCTLAELDAERKSQVSHRGKAFAALRNYLEENMKDMAMTNPYAADLGDRDPLEALADTPRRIRHAVDGWSDAGFERSHAPGKWSVRQVLTHLAQTELALGTRARFALAQEGYSAQAFSQDDWMPIDASADARLALDVYTTLRRLNVAMFHSLSPAQRDRTFQHPEYGALTVGWVAAQMAGHDLHHFKQIQIVARGS